MRTGLKEPAEVITAAFKGDGYVPNSPLPVIICKAVFAFGKLKLKPTVDELRKLAAENEWEYRWPGKIYRRTHFHPNVFEALAVRRGEAALQLGGNHVGQSFHVAEGDVIYIPPGVGHRRLHSTDNFLVFGFYPIGETYQTLWGWKKEYIAAEERSKNVPLPDRDPFFGKAGALPEYWGA